MKNSIIKFIKIIFLIVMNSSWNLMAQCGNVDPTGLAPDPVTSDFTSQSFNLRIYFVLIRKDDGSGDIQESILPGIMDELSDTYGPHNITFTQMCTRFIDSTSWYNDHNGVKLALNINSIGKAMASPDGVTVFIQKEDAPFGSRRITGQAGTGTTANPYFAYGWLQYDGQHQICSHEIGHMLGLYHTDNTEFGLSCVGIAAHDTIRGDLVSDTPIDYSHSEPIVNCTWDTSQCRNRFPNPCIDSCGGFLLDVDPTIIMSNVEYSCTNHFTTGQANRMKSHIINNSSGTFFDIVMEDDTISTNTTISAPKYFGKNIVILSGATLTVSSTIYMPSKGRIYIQGGGVLNLNGGTITKGPILDACDERTGDSKFWYGIEMQLSTSGPYPKFYCTDGTIEFSEFGIHNNLSRIAGNLLINIASGTFKNNKHSINILRGQYNAALPIFVKKARFYIDGSFPLANYYTQVKIDNSKIYFDSCKFDNPTTKHPLDSNSYCIRAMGATVGIQRTTFKDSLYGVQSLSAISTSTLNVTTSKFSKMYVGVNTTAGVNNYTINKDTFDTSWKYGLLSTRCTGYNITNNLFSNTGYHNNSVGILMHESGLAYNYIQKNVFSYLNYGDIAQGTNGDASVGLQYRCNTHINSNTKDFLLQGMVSGLQGSKANAAGNTSDGYVSFDLTSSSVGKITYYYRDISGERPTSSPSSKLNRVVADSLNCTLLGHSDTMTHIQVYIPKKDTLNIKHELYVDSIDGGNTAAMLSNIAAATSATAISIYNIVISKSPWLSPEVALALYNRNDHYDSTKRAQILYRNPDLFRSREFRAAISTASSPLSESSLTALDTLTSYTTSRTNLETLISDLHQEISSLCYDKLNELKIDTLDNSDSILVWLDRADDYGSRRELVEVHFRNGEFSNASSALFDLGGLSGLTTTQTSDVDGLGDLLPYLIDVRDDDRYEGTLNDTEIDWMIDFASDNHNQAGEEVKSILQFYYNIDVGGSESHKKSHDQVNAIRGENVALPKNNVVSDGINIYPNPSKNELIIVLPSKETSWNIDLLDLNGRVLSRFSADSNKAKINLSGLNTGVYLIHLTNAKGESFNKRIQIIK